MAKTVWEILAEPLRPNARTDDCPYQRGVCHLVPDGGDRFACRICGTGYWGGLESFDWHGDYPWQIDA